MENRERKESLYILSIKNEIWGFIYKRVLKEKSLKKLNGVYWIVNIIHKLETLKNKFRILQNKFPMTKIII